MTSWTVPLSGEYLKRTARPPDYWNFRDCAPWVLRTFYVSSLLRVNWQQAGEQEKKRTKHAANNDNLNISKGCICNHDAQR